MISDFHNLPPVPSESLLKASWRWLLVNLKPGNYARFKGRAGRFEYWSVTILGSILSLFPLLLPLCCYLESLSPLFVLSLLPVCYLSVPMLAVYVRRLHDTGWSSFWIILQYGIISLLFGALMFHVAQNFQNPSYYTYPIIDFCFDMSPWLVYLRLPFVCVNLFLFTLCLMPGTPGKNRYGEKV